MKFFLVVISYQVLVINIKILNKGALVTLEMKLKVPILAIFIWKFLEAICFGIQDQEQKYFYENLVQYF